MKKMPDSVAILTNVQLAGSEMIQGSTTVRRGVNLAANPLSSCCSGSELASRATQVPRCTTLEALEQRVQMLCLYLYGRFGYTGLQAFHLGKDAKRRLQNFQHLRHSNFTALLLTLSDQTT